MYYLPRNITLDQCLELYDNAKPPIGAENDVAVAEKDRLEDREDYNNKDSMSLLLKTMSMSLLPNVINIYLILRVL